MIMEKISIIMKKNIKRYGKIKIKIYNRKVMRVL